MRRITAVLAVMSVALPLAGQARRPAPKAFPLSISGSLLLNSYGVRAQEVDAIILQCTNLNCIDHGFSKGPGVGVELQAPIAGNVGFGVGLDALTMVRRRCISGAECSTRGRIFGLRARGQFLFRLKARAPIYFGIGAAALRNDPGSVELQTVATTVDVGGVFTIGGDFAAGPRTRVRVAWHSFFLKADDNGLPVTFSTGTAHDGALTIGASFLLAP